MRTTDRLKKFIKKGKDGKNEGVPGGLTRFDKATVGTQRGWIYTLVGTPGAGKSFMLLYRYILYPWSIGVRNVTWKFFSLEMPEEMVLSRILGYFYYKRYNKRIALRTIAGFYKNDKLDSQQYSKILKVIDEDLDPLMEKLTIITDRNASNPTGIYKYIFEYAEKNGTIHSKNLEIKEGNKSKKVKVFDYYEPHNQDERVQILLDHCGLMKKEQGFNQKQNIDQWVDDYAVRVSNNFGYTIVNVAQLNRNIYDGKRIRSESDLIPSPSDIKSTSAYEQSSDQILALFNPYSIKIKNITRHCNYKMKHYNNLYRSFHVIKSRYTKYPLNISLILDPHTGIFGELPKPGNTKLNKFKSLTKKIINI